MARLAYRGALTELLSETIRVPLPGKGTAVVEGWVRDRRKRMDLRITLPDAQTILAEGSRRGGWFVWFEGDEMSMVGGDDLHGNLAALLGYWDSPRPWPKWLERLAERVLA